MKAYEANFDGLVGPTHNYSGLSYGNVASMTHKAMVSNPREAALQGLAKMKALADWGLTQGVLAPQERPDVATLRKLGFSGSDAQVLESALKKAPEVLAACASASSMWTANAATVSPSADSADGRVHFTPANLVNKFHRSIEPETTARILRATFPDPSRFVHHEPLPTGGAFGDEGAANHTRFSREYGEPGVQFFVYGRVGLETGGVEPKKFPARHTLETSQVIARLHQLHPSRVVYAQQNPDAIDAGAFHNDVVSVGNQNVLFFHERAFLNGHRVLSDLKKAFEETCRQQFIGVEVKEKDVSMADAVKSYLFNSQLIARPQGGMALIAPNDCKEIGSIRRFTETLTADPNSPIREIRFFDLRQSMQNGGGPACLRLRVVLSEAELHAVNAKTLITDATHARLMDWVNRHYRDRMELKDLADPSLVTEVRTALDELTQILGLGSVYPFQL